MDIQSVLTQIKSKPEKFPRFYAVLESVAVNIREKWEFVAAKRAGITVKEGGLGWWGAQYLANGQIKVERSGIGYKIYYHQGRGKYDYAKIVEDGRSPYDIASNLLATSRKVRISKKGKKYLIVPMEGDKDSASQVLSIVSTAKQPSPLGGTVKRNKYRTTKPQNKIQSKKKTTAFSQKQERGGTSTSYKNLVVLTEDSRWNPYPQIKAQKLAEKLQAEVNKTLNNQEFKKQLAEALAMDLRAGRKK